MSTDAAERNSANSLYTGLPGEVVLDSHQVSLNMRKLGPSGFYKTFGWLPPIAGGAGDDDDVDTDEETERIARRAAARLAAEEKNKPSSTSEEDEEDEEDEDDKNPEPEDEESEEEEELDVTDDEVRAWLKEVTNTPEIKQIIKAAARELASKDVKTSITQAREELQEEFDERLEDIRRELASGRIDKRQAKSKVKKAAEGVVEEADDDTDDEAERLREEAQEREAKRREDKLKLREIKAYRREQLAEEDQNKLIPEMIVVIADTSEEEVDRMIEESKARYTKMRKSIIAELKSQGWKGPKELKRLAETSSEEGEEEEEEPPTPPRGGPPTREQTEPAQISKKRRASLRERFGYGPNGANQNASERRLPTPTQ